MSEQTQYLYLDSTIVGTAKQIVCFFRQGVFSEHTTVLVKQYKHCSHKEIVGILRQAGIPFRVVKNSDLDKLASGVVFYPFNAQSNVRFVANRRLTHIFITHGESNKVSSVKPILRIYDYVATAGEAGIDRLLQHKIFSEYDVTQGRLKKIGDTFVGQTGLNPQAKEKVILYAPTWEGGIPSENYSSLQQTGITADYLQQACDLYGCRHIIIRPHPNTGHRLPEYREHLYKLAARLAKQGLAVSLYCWQLVPGFWQRRQLKKAGVSLVDNLAAFAAQAAFCDLSAIETQLLNEYIPYYIFSTAAHVHDFFYRRHNQIYQRCMLDWEQPAGRLAPLTADDFAELRGYVVAALPDTSERQNRISMLLESIETALN